MNFEIVAFYPTDKGKLISQMRVSPTVFEKTESGIIFNKQVESGIKNHIAKSFAGKTDKVEADKIKFYLHEFIESEEEIDGKTETFKSTWGKYPVFC